MPCAVHSFTVGFCQRFVDNVQQRGLALGDENDKGFRLLRDGEFPRTKHQIRVGVHDDLGVALGHGESFNAAVLQLENAGPDITDGHGIGVGKLRSDKLHLQRGVLCADVNTVKIFRGRVLFRVGGTDQNDRLNFVIAIIVIIGDLIAFSSLLGPDVAGNGHRNRSGIHGGLAGIKAHRLNDKLYTNIVGDVLGKENVQPYILLLPVLGGIDKLHWGKIGGQGDMQLAGGLDLVKNAVGCGARFGWGCVRYRPCGGSLRRAAGAEHEKRNSGESERKDFDKWFLFHGCMPPMRDGFLFKMVRILAYLSTQVNTRMRKNSEYLRYYK